MRVPFQVRVAAVVAGVAAKEFVAGWMNGLARWETARHHAAGWSHPPANPFTEGTTAHAASEAAVTFMRERRP